MRPDRYSGEAQRVHVLPLVSFRTRPPMNFGSLTQIIRTFIVFHLLQVEINAHPAQTSAPPANAAQAQPGMHRKSSTNPPLMSAHPASHQNRSAEDRQHPRGAGRYGPYLTFRMVDSSASMAGYATSAGKMRVLLQASVTFVVYNGAKIV